jgi:hypothetical protein
MKSLTEFATLDEYMQQVIKPRLSHIKKKKKDAKERLAALKRDMLLAEKELEDSKEELEQELFRTPVLQFDKFKKTVAGLDWGQALILPTERFEFIKRYLNGCKLENAEQEALAKHIDSFMDENGFYFFSVKFNRAFYPVGKYITQEDCDDENYTLVLCKNEGDPEYEYVDVDGARRQLEKQHFDGLHIALSKSYFKWEDEGPLLADYVDAEPVKDTGYVFAKGFAILDEEVFGIAKWK